MFEYFKLIVFHLVERIAIVKKSSTEVLRKCSCMLGFSYNAIPTRHEVPRKPYLQEEYNIMTNEPTKLSNIADMAKQKTRQHHSFIGGGLVISLPPIYKGIAKR